MTTVELGQPGLHVSLLQADLVYHPLGTDLLDEPVHFESPERLDHQVFSRPQLDDQDQGVRFGESQFAHLLELHLQLDTEFASPQHQQFLD